MARGGRRAGQSILRVGLGLIFLFYGIGKFQTGVAAVADGMVRQFQHTFLPSALVRLFATLLPFGEVTVGALLILGIAKRWVLILAGLLMLVLTAGTAILSLAPVVATNLIYLLVISYLLRHIEDETKGS